MAKRSINKFTRRFIIVVICVNIFALWANHFSVSPRFKIEGDDAIWDFYLFTDSGEKSIFFQSTDNTTTHSNNSRRVAKTRNNTKTLKRTDSNSTLYHERSPSKFWPFTEFGTKTTVLNSKDYYRFRGLFPDYDVSELLAYIGFLLAFLIIKKVW